MNNALQYAIDLRDILDKAIRMYEAGEITEDDMREIARTLDFNVKMGVTSVTPPSPEVLAAVGESQDARKAFIEQTAERRSAAIALQVASHLLTVFMPAVGSMLRRFGVTVVALLAILLAAPGCSAQVGSDDSPAVQVGPTSQPMVDAQADVTATALVDARADLAVASPRVDLAGAADLRVDGSTATSQPATQVNASSAGGDNRPIGINVNASGSGWPLVVVVLSCGVVMIYMHVVDRQWRKIKAGQMEYETLERNALGVASAIRDMGQTPDRDRLLDLIQSRLPHREAWDKTIKPYLVE